MPIFLLNLLPILKKNWKIIAVIAVVVATFGAGWKANGWRLESKYEGEEAKRQAAITAEIQRLEAELRREYVLQLEKVEEINDALSAEITHIRITNDALSAEINATTTLVKSTADVTCIDNETGIAHEAQPNPFSDDFVRLWNAAGGMRND